MASSQVEFASSSPFGCVLRDHNQRDRCRETNARAAFQKNLKELVRDHLHSRISISSSSNENYQHQSNNRNPWVGDEQRENHPNLRFMSNNNENDNRDESSSMSPRQSRILDRWAARQARDMVSTIERQAHEADLLATRAPTTSHDSSLSHSDGSIEIPNRAASSLVQMWEARLNRSMSSNQNSAVGSSRTNSGLSCVDNAFSIEEPSRGSEVSDSVDERIEAQVNNEDSLEDWESDRTTQSNPSSSLHGQNTESGESERVRVVDIIKRLMLANPTQGPSTSRSNENDHEQQPIVDGSPHRDHAEQRSFSQIVSLPRIRERCSALDQGEQRGFSQSVSSPRIRERCSALDHAEQRGSSQSVSSPRAREHPSALDQAEQRSFPPALSLLRLRERSAAMVQAEQRGLSPVVNSPRLRGRQAFNDLLMQMERDRQRELDALKDRRAVSRFSQRGRIQSMLRLRFLQGGQAIQDQSSSHTTAAQSSRPQGSSIMLLREIFNTRVGHVGVTAMSGEGNLRTAHSEIPDDRRDSGNSSSLHSFIEDNNHQEASATEHHRTPSVQPSESYDTEDLHDEASLSSDVTWQGTSYEANNLGAQETADNGWDENVTEEEQETNDQQLISNNYDWFSDVSRPRTYWEGLRQAWYQEVFDSSSNNEEIRQLLERRRVSTFLASDFRQRMDQLMMSRLHRQTHPMGSPEEDRDELGNQDRMDQLMMSFFQRHRQPVSSQEGEDYEDADGDGEDDNEQEEGEEDAEEDEEEEEEDHEEEEGSQSERQHRRVGDYFDQTASSSQLPLQSPLTSWSSYQDLEAGDDFDPVESTSTGQPLQSQSHNHDTRQYSSSINRPSIEMELIYDLRGHMEQLHHEMSELRKSIKSCMDMQVKLQHSIEHEAHSVRGEGKKPKVPKKHSCCICYEMQVDSLLYRCGHMCTCLKCAHELQWSSGKCPICRAPIEDVVRAYADS